MSEGVDTMVGEEFLYASGFAVDEFTFPPRSFDLVYSNHALNNKIEPRDVSTVLEYVPSLLKPASSVAILHVGEELGAPSNGARICGNTPKVIFYATFTTTQGPIHVALLYAWTTWHNWCALMMVLARGTLPSIFSDLTQLSDMSESIKHSQAYRLRPVLSTLDSWVTNQTKNSMISLPGI
eukprot:g56091.t1